MARVLVLWIQKSLCRFADLCCIARDCWKLSILREGIVRLVMSACVHRADYTASRRYDIPEAVALEGVSGSSTLTESITDSIADSISELMVWSRSVLRPGSSD